MPHDLKLRLPEVVVPGRRLGRHIQHDPRSLRFLTPESATPPADVLHAERAPILDQGDVGSCTGNALTGMLATDSFFETLPQATVLDEAFAVQRYSRATQVDGYPGTYKPDDTGSDGLSVCKAAQADGLLSGYTHATSLAGCWSMISAGAFILGISWYEGMDDPDAHGDVEVAGQVRGGHEVCAVGRTSGRWVVRNSWGESWGDAGHFCLTDAQLTRLLAEQGDATQGVPVTAPPPTPGPPPTPASAWAAFEDQVLPTYRQWKSHPIKMRRPLEAVLDAWVAQQD